MAENQIEEILNKYSNEDAQKILKVLNKYSDKEIKALITQATKNPKQSSEAYNLNGNIAKFGVISDTHIGNKCYDEPLMDAASKEFNRRKVDFVVHGGDICDGLYTNRQGHVFELDQIGADEQVEKAIQELGKIKRPLFFITGNHTWNTFYKNAGYDIGRTLEKSLDDCVYLGNAQGDLALDYDKKIRLIHPDGGSSYALSYKPQKIIESLEGGTKPEVLIIGHFHKAEYLFYRNVHTLQAGCLESQTPFMKNKGLSAHKGFWIVTAKVNKDGISKFVPEFYPAY